MSLQSTKKINNKELVLQAKRINPSPGTFGMQRHTSHTLVTVYCPLNFEIFQVRINMVMTVHDFKKKLALKYETPIDNIVISNGEMEFGGDPTNKEAFKNV